MFVKKKYVIILSLLIIVIFSLFTFYFLKSKEVFIQFDKNIELNIFDEKYNTDFIKEIKNGSIYTKKKLIDTNTLGEKVIQIGVLDFFHRKRVFSYKVLVVDKERPTISFQNQLSTDEGKEIDLLSGVSASDNSREEIKVTVDGEYDFNKVGSYHLFYVAKDSSGNETKEEFVLDVKEKKPIITSNTSISDSSFVTSKGFSGYTKNGITYINGILIANKTYSLPSSYYPGGLTNDTTVHMNQMFADAAFVGLNIYLSSGFRSYNTQNIIYHNYVSWDGKENADTYSARPGHSEHQTGLAFDVNQVDNSFDNTPEAEWLSQNCYKYGFILRYPKGKTHETGYMYESWHFRYVGVDLASKLYNNGDWITLENYFGITSQYNY